MSTTRSAFVPHDLANPLCTRSDGPLAGFTIAVKDMYAIAGERTSGGNPDWLAAQVPAGVHAVAVQRILEAGGTIVGKTVCDEFFYGVTGMNAHFGTPVNPRAPSRIPGGSSSGSAAACSAGACDLAVGSDTAGSVRVPAALCGIFGIRVSLGRMNLSGAMAMAHSFDAGGWVAAAPGLFKRMGAVLLEPKPSATSKVIQRTAFLDDAFAHADPRIRELALQFLARASAEIPALHHDIAAGEMIDEWREAMRVKQAFEAWQTFGGFVELHDVELGAGVAERMRMASGITAADVRLVTPTLDLVRARMEGLTADGTVLVLPTVASVAPLLTASEQELDAYRVATMRLNCMASISGLPQVTIPFATLDGAPVGLSFIGWHGSDEVLLDLVAGVARYIR